MHVEACLVHAPPLLQLSAAPGPVIPGPCLQYDQHPPSCWSGHQPYLQTLHNCRNNVGCQTAKQKVSQLLAAMMNECNSKQLSYSAASQTFAVRYSYTDFHCSVSDLPSKLSAQQASLLGAKHPSDPESSADTHEPWGALSARRLNNYHFQSHNAGCDFDYMPCRTVKLHHMS